MAAAALGARRRGALMMVARAGRGTRTGMNRPNISELSAVSRPSKKPSGIEAPTISQRLGLLAASGKVAELMMRLSGAATPSWSSVWRRRPTKASYCALVESALDCNACNSTRAWFWPLACRSTWFRLACREFKCAWAVATSLPIEPAMRVTSCAILASRSRFCACTAMSLGCSGPYLLARSASCRIKSACWLRNCTITGDATTWLTSPALPAAADVPTLSFSACFSASSERVCTIWALIAAIC